jgi:hypothetical protein
VQLFPNPAVDYIHIEHAEDVILELSLYSKGTLLKPFANAGKLDVRDLTPGIYFLRIEDEKGRVQLRKVVVARD